MTDQLRLENITTDKIKLAASTGGRPLTDEQAALLQAFIHRLGSIERAVAAMAALGEVEKAA